VAGVLTATLWCSALAVEAITAMIAPAPITDPAAMLAFTRRSRRSAASRWACGFSMTRSLH
jgi:hypothetical protein